MDATSQGPAGGPVKDVTEATFEQDVLLRSREVPVLVDFWAPWCGPCRVLGPLIENEVAALGGRVELTKVNTDENPNLAMQFAIQSIPAVKAFRDGQVVDQFVGALPIPQLREFLARLVPSGSEQGISGAIKLLTAGRMDEGAAALEKLLGDETVGGDAGFHLAHVLLQRATNPNSVERARELATRVAPTSDLQPRIPALLELAKLVGDGLAAGEIGNLEGQVAANGKDHAARLHLAGALVARGQIEDALEELLQSVSRDSKWEDGAARKAMVAIFDHLDAPGQNSEMARDFRRRLQVVL